MPSEGLCFLSITPSREVFWGALTKMEMRTESFVHCRTTFSTYSLSRFGALSKKELFWSSPEASLTLPQTGCYQVDPSCPVTSARGSCASYQVCCCQGFCSGACSTGSPSLPASTKHSQCFHVDSTSHRAQLTAPLAWTHCCSQLWSGTSLLGDSICLGCSPSSGLRI